MPRRLLFKEGGLAGQFAPEGFKLVGYQDGTFTEAGTASVTKVGDDIPKVFVLARNVDVYRNPMTNGFSTITGYDGSKLGPVQTGSARFDYDLSQGNYSQIIYDSVGKSIKLPETESSKNLEQLWIRGYTGITYSVEVDLTKYPNLGYCLIGGMPYKVGIGNSKTGDNYETDYRPTFLITSSTIDLPYCAGLMLGLSDYTLSVNFEQSVQTMKVYSDSYVWLCSPDLTEINLDYQSYTWSQIDFYSEIRDPEYKQDLYISGCPYLDTINIQNLSQLEHSPNSRVRLDFSRNNLSQASVDGILQALDEAYPNTFTNTPVLRLGKANSDLSTEPTVDNELTVGQKYVIKELQSGDDFSNVGYVTSGVEFTATGQFPTNWSNGTLVYLGSNFGIAKSISFESTDGTIPDGVYVLPDIAGKGAVAKVEFVEEDITRYQILQSQPTYDQYVGTFSLTLDTLLKTDELGREIYRGSATQSMILNVTSIGTNAQPTDGENNTNYLSLIAKGWDVTISVS